MRLALGYFLLVCAVGLMSVPGKAQAAECVASAPATQIGPDEARQLYDCIEAAMAAGYAKSEGVPGVAEYRDWQLLSTSPFVSATHGSMLINHHANPVAAEIYMKWEGMVGQRFPEGSILAKESFRITRSGEVRAGPLFMMEKAAPGAAPETDDWIYTRVFTSGKVQRTLGLQSDRMNFCHDCHVATLDAFDGMFFPPKEFRVPVQ